MSKADDMFKELGYSILKDDRNEIVVHYIKSSNLSANESEHIVFYKTKMVGCYYTYCTFKKELSTKELQAINEKCKELRLAMKKEWKEIKGYEGKYIISNYGEIISLPRYKENKSKMQYVEPREICKYVNKKNGYVYVQLWNNAEYKNIRLHRLVAEHFIEKVEGKEQINHIDGNKQNNRADNLEWCTCRENIQHAYKMGLR